MASTAISDIQALLAVTDRDLDALEGILGTLAEAPNQACFLEEGDLARHDPVEVDASTMKVHEPDHVLQGSA